MNTKQVIVFRKDLLKGPNAIRKGKFGAQVAHASLGALLQLFNKIEYHQTNLINGTLTTDATQTFYRYCVDFSNNSVLNDWLNGKFTKVVVSVDSDEELIALNKALDKTWIPHALITDSGLTEFHGVPTNTCLGIGPYEAEEIDKFTGNLPLL